MSKFLYPIYKLNIESYKKWWLYHKKAGGSGVLSEILEGFSFNLANTLNRKFKLFEIEGNSDQESTKGYQLLNPADFNDSLTNNGITFTNNGDGSITINGTSTGTAMLQLDKIKKTLKAGKYTFSLTNGIKDKLYMIWSAPYNSTNTIGTDMLYKEVTFDSDTELTYIYIQIPSGHTFNNVVVYPMIYEGSYDSSKPWEKYTGEIASPNPNYEQPIKSAGDNGSINEKITNADRTEEQDYSIFVQQPMRSIGDVRDCFVKKSDGWYERHYIGEVVLDGTENWSRSDTEGFVRYVVTLANMKSVGATRSTNILCNKFKGSIENGYGNCFAFNNTVAFYVPENIENFSAWKNWLEENNVKLQYELAEPLDLPCTETQIQQLENLPSTYKDFTIIQSQDETPAHLKIQYYKEG